MTPTSPAPPAASGSGSRPDSRSALGSRPSAARSTAASAAAAGSRAAGFRAGRLWAIGFAVIAVAALAIALQRGYNAWQAGQANALIARGETVDRAPPQVIFAHALALERAGRHDDALAAYAEAEVLGDEALRHAVRVNVANLYLRRGIDAAKDEGNAQRATVLIQLAKAGYRRALRDNPHDWNARYNFELALRILPDLEIRNWRRSGSESEIEENEKKEKSAWAEMVGQPRGMH